MIYEYKNLGLFSDIFRNAWRPPTNNRQRKAKYSPKASRLRRKGKRVQP